MEILANNLVNIRIETPPSFESDGLSNDDIISVVSANLDFEVVVLDRVGAPKPLVFESSNGSVTVEYPEEVVALGEQNSFSRLFGVYSAHFETINHLLEAEGVTKPGRENGSSSMNIASGVLSAQVVRVKEGVFSNLSSPIVITFKHLEDRFYNGSAMCAFINEASSGNTDIWDDTGCFLAEQNATHSVCHCYHMTNFALLMDIFKIQLPPIHDAVLSYISYIGGSLSILGCTLAIITYEYLRLRGERVRIHEMLASSIILSQLTFFVGFDRTEHPEICKAFAILLHYALTSMFCWMLVEGIHLYMAVIKVFRTGNCLKKYMLVGWGLPLLSVLISCIVFFDEYANNQYCWLSNKLLLIAFVPFVAIVIVANTVILIVVIRVMTKSLQSVNLSKNTTEDLPSAKAALKATLILLPLLGLTWVFGFLSVGTGASLMFTYLFTITNSVQGVMFFVFHCLLNSDVKQAFVRKSSAPRTHHTPPSNDSSDNPSVIRKLNKRTTATTGDGLTQLPSADGMVVVSSNKSSPEVSFSRATVVNNMSSATSTESIETNQTVVDDSADSLHEKSEREMSEKVLKEMENQGSRRHCSYILGDSSRCGSSSASSRASSSAGSRSTSSSARSNSLCMDRNRRVAGPKSRSQLSMSPAKCLKYRGKARDAKPESHEIQEALDILDSAFVDEENYI